MIYDDKIDFHEFGLLEPNQVIFFTEKFIKDSYDQGLKKLLIITGKGNGNTASVGVVKSTVYKILKSNKLVKIYSVASEWNGGSGAFEVWLKD